MALAINTAVVGFVNLRNESRHGNYQIFFLKMRQPKKKGSHAQAVGTLTNTLSHGRPSQRQP